MTSSELKASSSPRLCPLSHGPPSNTKVVNARGAYHTTALPPLPSCTSASLPGDEAAQVGRHSTFLRQTSRPTASPSSQPHQITHSASSLSMTRPSPPRAIYTPSKSSQPLDSCLPQFGSGQMIASLARASSVNEALRYSSMALPTSSCPAEAPGIAS